MCRVFHSAVICIIALLLSACGREPAYSEFCVLSSDGWADTTALHFQSDTLAPGTYIVNLSVRCRVAQSYPYKKLALLLQYIADTCNADTTPALGPKHPTATAPHTALRPLRTKTVTLPLAVGSRELLGKGLALRDTWHTADTLHLADTTCLTINIRHQMHPTSLAGIEAIGVFLEK